MFFNRSPKFFDQAKALTQQENEEDKDQFFDAKNIFSQLKAKI